MKKRPPQASNKFEKQEPAAGAYKWKNKSPPQAPKNIEKQEPAAGAEKF